MDSQADMPLVVDTRDARVGIWDFERESFEEVAPSIREFIENLLVELRPSA